MQLRKDGAEHVLLVPIGTTSWYCTRPRRPYSRGHASSTSSGNMCLPMPSRRPRSRSRRDAKAQLVVGAHGGRTQQPRRPAWGHPRAGVERGTAARGLRTGRQVDVAGPRDDTAARSSAEQVEPGDAVFATGRFEHCKRGVEIRNAVGVHGEQGAAHTTRRIRAQTITPVSPIPPVVARTAPVAGWSRAQATRRPTSAARAPPHACRTFPHSRGSCRGCRRRSRRRP